MPCVIRLLRATTPAARSHDFTEYERLVKAATAEDRQALMVVLLGGDAGLRCGEMMALERDDLDFQKQRICVQRSDWKGHVTVPKGGRLRYVPMTMRLRAALRDHRHLRGKRVLCRRDGTALTQKIVQDYVRRSAQKAGVKNGVHLLRHAFCSRLAMLGAAPRVIQELAGHENWSTTERYMHLIPGQADAAIRLLEQPKGRENRGDIVETGSSEIGNPLARRSEVVEAGGSRTRT
jgi:site-specific recombinase XerD